MNPFQGTLPAVDPARLQQHLQSIAMVRNQILNPLAIKKVMRYITEQFESSGLSVKREAFYSLLAGWGPQYNLIATLAPRTQAETKPEASRVIIGAHYDTVPFSPGADDNASGVAILLETARVCVAAKGMTRCPIDFIAFGMEEEGCIGSCRHATRLVKAGTQVAAMVSLECVGFTSDRPDSQVVPPGLPVHVPDRGTFLAVIGNQCASGLVDLMQSSATTHAPELQAIGLVVEDNGHQLPATRLSDHAPFWDRGFPALMLTDTAFMRNPNYHRPSDRPETLDFKFMTEITQAVAAFALAAAE